MSRSNYSDSGDPWDFVRWRGAVKSAIRGQRGQTFLREMLVALDALPTQELVRGELENERGVCAIGSVGRLRSMDMSQLDPHDYRALSAALGVPRALVQEIEYINDTNTYNTQADQELSQDRFTRVRAWVVSQLSN